MDQGRASLERDLHKIFSNAGLTGVGEIFFKIFNYLTIWMVIKSIGAAQYGVYLLAWTVISFASILAGFGFPAGLLKFIAQYYGQEDKARAKGALLFPLSFSLTLSLLMIPCLFFLAPYLEHWLFKKPGISMSLQWLSFGLPFAACLSLLSSSLQGCQMIKYLIYVEKIWQSLFFFLLTMLFFLFGFTLNGLIMAKIGSMAISCALALYYLNRLFPIFNSSLKPIYEKQKMLFFSAPLVLAVFLNFFVLYTDILMLGYFSTSQAVGIYGVLARLVPLIVLPLTAFETIFSPMVADLFHKKEFGRLEQLHKFTTKWICIFSLPVFGLILLFSRPLLSFFGEEFTIASIPLAVLALGQISRVCVGISGYIILMTGHQNLSLFNNLLLFGLNSFLNYLLIPHYGILGAAAATSFSYFTVNMIEMLQILRFLHIHPYNLEVFKPHLAGVLCFLPVFLFLQAVKWPLLSEVLAGTTLFLGGYLVLLYHLGFTQEDTFLLTLVKKLSP